jgi:hypothetical protein
MQNNYNNENVNFILCRGLFNSLGEQMDCKTTGSITFILKEIWDMLLGGTPIQKLLNIRTSYRVAAVPRSKTDPEIACPEVCAFSLILLNNFCTNIIKQTAPAFFIFPNQYSQPPF